MGVAKSYKLFNISIHALREEGDSYGKQYFPKKKYFYPRPP